MGGGRRERASDGSLVIREYRERVNLSAPHVRCRFENRDPRDYTGRAARQNSAESAAIKAGESLLLRVKSSERLSFVKSRLRVPNWPPRTIVVRMESTHELEEA